MHSPSSEYISKWLKYIQEWIIRLNFHELDILKEPLSKIGKYWEGDTTINLEEIKVNLWKWVDLNGGPGISQNKEMIAVRMTLCLCYDDLLTFEELDQLGFFEDLLSVAGVSQEEIQKYLLK